MDYTDETLELAPQRIAKFLNGLGALPSAQTLLFQAGMTDDDLVEGRTLLLDCLAAPRPAPAPESPAVRAQREATAELDAWDEPGFARYGAVLARHAPDAGAYVFANLAPSTGSNAVAGVATFLARVDALDKGTDPARAASKAADAAAVKLLGKRKLDGAERARLQALVEVALGPTKAPAEQPKDDGGRRAKLVAARAWFDEWSSTARAVLKKHGWLVRLGLASRKSPKKDDKAPK
jgi:hypothetical protein